MARKVIAPERITHESVIVSEGEDDKGFIEAILTKMDIRNVQVLCADGKVTVEYIRAVANTPGFGAVRNVAVIRDADSNPSGSWQSVQNVLKLLEGTAFPTRPGEIVQSATRRVGGFLFPGLDTPGCLEDLCWASVQDSPVAFCVDQYMRCLESRCERKVPEAGEDTNICFFPGNESKARVQAYLAGRYKLQKGVGSAAKKGYWNLKHERLAPLRSFLRALCQP